MSEEETAKKNIPGKAIADLIVAARSSGQNDMVNLWATQAITLALVIARLHHAGLLPLEGVLADLETQANGAADGSPEQLAFRELIVHIHAAVARLQPENHSAPGASEPPLGQTE